MFRVSSFIPEFEAACRQVLPNVPIVTIPNTVPAFAEQTLSEGKTIICVSSFNASKRPELLVDAFALVQKDFPDWKVEFWGRYEKNGTEQIQKRIQSYRLEKQFVLCGTTKEIPKKLKAATIFAFPSIHEGFGLALTEAMAMGLPVVACKDCAACRSLIRNGENGLLSEPTPQAFAEALKMLIRDRELRMRLGAAAREDMKQFAADKIWDRWDRLIQQLIRNQIII